MTLGLLHAVRMRDVAMVPNWPRPVSRGLRRGHRGRGRRSRTERHGDSGPRSAGGDALIDGRAIPPPAGAAKGALRRALMGAAATTPTSIERSSTSWRLLSHRTKSCPAGPRRPHHDDHCEQAAVADGSDAGDLGACGVAADAEEIASILCRPATRPPNQCPATRAPEWFVSMGTLSDGAVVWTCGSVSGRIECDAACILLYRTLMARLARCSMRFWLSSKCHHAGNIWASKARHVEQGPYGPGWVMMNTRPSGFDLIQRATSAADRLSRTGSSRSSTSTAARRLRRRCSWCACAA